MKKKKTRKKQGKVNRVLAIVLAVLLTVGACGLIYTLFTRHTYTAEAEVYKELGKFAYWSDKTGDKVSEENPYTYHAKAEKELTAVYEDFIDVKVVEEASGATASFDKNTLTYNTNNWFNLAYLTEPLTYGMAVNFEFSGSQILFGVSELNRIENSEKYGWGLNYAKLFVPQANVYASKAEDPTPVSLIQSTTSTHGAKSKVLSDANIADLAKHTATIIVHDKLIVYVDGKQFLTDDKSWDLDKTKEYYLTLAGICTYTFTDIRNVEKFIGKKITYLGDSITEGVGSNFTNAAVQRYSHVLTTELGATEYNMGISGTVLCTGNASRKSRISDVDKIPEDSDYVIVMLGTNDFDQAAKGFAELGEEGSDDTSTVHGAANALCEKLQKKFKKTDVKVYIVTPISRQNDVKNELKCANDYTLRDFSEVLIHYAEKYNLNYFDLNAESGITADDMANNLHPNALGTAKMVTALKGALLAK